MGGEPKLALDNIVAVVDCARMYDEFNGGRDLLAEDIDEDDIESLLIQQIEFCSTLILNKTDTVSPEQIAELKAIVRSLQKDAVIVEAQNGEVPMEELLDTDRFDFMRAYNSAAWIEAMEHPEEHDDPEVLEYDIETFVYSRRKPFDLQKFTDFVEQEWPDEVIRVKGPLWQTGDPDMCYMFEQAGHQMRLMENGLFVDSAPEGEKQKIIDENPEIMQIWDDETGDRMTSLCIIGRHMDKDALIASLDSGHLAGAALDVVVPEPLPADHPLRKAKNLLLTPHVAGNMTLGYTCERNVQLFCENLENYAAGRPMHHLVDRRKGY